MRKEMRTFLVLVLVGALAIPLTIGTPNDRVTGGGWIDDFKKTFGFVAMSNGGELQYDDHVSGVQIHGIVDPNSLTIYKNQGTKTFTGTATFTGVIRGTTHTFTVNVEDNGEPGNSVDTFFITTSTGYTAGGTLEGGNIQVDP